MLRKSKMEGQEPPKKKLLQPVRVNKSHCKEVLGSTSERVIFSPSKTSKKHAVELGSQVFLRLKAHIQGIPVDGNDVPYEKSTVLARIKRHFGLTVVKAQNTYRQTVKRRLKKVINFERKDFIENLKHLHANKRVNMVVYSICEKIGEVEPAKDDDGSTVNKVVLRSSFIRLIIAFVEALISGESDKDCYGSVKSSITAVKLKPSNFLEAAKKHQAGLGHDDLAEQKQLIEDIDNGAFIGGEEIEEKAPIKAGSDADEEEEDDSDLSDITDFSD
eukprot:TRINITY_DN12300_c0_g1_i1.p1 TRINITY_DN12300_c0_g1~~TRINITY_DN12300_c0_g1_i1.p1  ORF type:complete len:274 (-),score=70.41 TRINITY_DN12300_c0_g1_i1:129-950(-)